MAISNTTINPHAINPLIGSLPGDTLSNCSNVLMVLELYGTEGEPSAKEVMGMSLIHNVIRAALDYEIDRDQNSIDIENKVTGNTQSYPPAANSN